MIGSRSNLTASIRMWDYSGPDQSLGKDGVGGESKDGQSLGPQVLTKGKQKDGKLFEAWQ